MCLNLRFFFFFFQITKKMCQITVQGSDLEPIFGNWSQSEKLSEIKLPLANSFDRTGHSSDIISLFKSTIKGSFIVNLKHSN